MQYYRKLQSAHSNQTLTMLDGAQTQRYGRLERGVIQGDCRNMQVIIADKKGFDGLGFDATIGSQDDSYAVVNLFDSVNRYIDSVAIAGADDADHAIHLALSQFDYLEPAYATLVANEGDGSFEPSFDSLCWESDTIGKLMNNRSQDRGHYLPIITQKMLVTEKNRVTHNDVLWDGVNLVSHEGDYSRLLVDIQKNDSHHELTAQFDMAGFLANLDVTELGLDALMDTNNRLDLMKERLFRALAKQSVDGLSVTDAVLTKPFKKAGMANVAMQFNLSDGQTFTILFHNPDADPKKLGAQDTMVSWKWMLNKRDITAAVSPKNGENVQLAPLATRMMKVAKANSKRFAAAQSKKAQNQQALTDAQKEVDDKKAKLDAINAHIAELQTELEKVGSADGGNTEQAAEANGEDYSILGNIPDVSKADKKTAFSYAQKLLKFSQTDISLKLDKKDFIGMGIDEVKQKLDGITQKAQDEDALLQKAFNRLFNACMVKDRDTIKEVANDAMGYLRHGYNSKSRLAQAMRITGDVTKDILDSLKKYGLLEKYRNKEITLPDFEAMNQESTQQTTTTTADLTARQQAAAMEKFNEAKSILLDNGWRQFNKNSPGVEYPYYANGTEGRIITAYPQDDGHATVKVIAGLNDDETENVIGHVMSDMAKDAQDLAQQLNNLVKNWVLDNGHSLHPIIEQEEKLAQTDKPLSEPTEPTPKPQSTAPTSELSPEERKLNNLIKERDMMKDINKITRMKISDDEKIAKIMEFGIKQDTARTLATGEGTWDKRPGFAPYQLTSVNNRIKTLQAKVDAMKKADEINNSLGGEDMVLAGVSIILNKEADRIQLDFPSKPSRDVIAILKKNGWKWSPSNQVWQRQLTENAMRNARTMVEAYADDEGIDMEDETNTTPTQAAPQTPPEPEGGDEGDTNPDADYLQTVIDGSIGLSTDNMKQVITEIKRIAKAGAVDKDLLNQAIEAYQKFALSVKVA